MKVKELKELLKNADDEADVYIIDSEFGEGSLTEVEIDNKYGQVYLS